MKFCATAAPIFGGFFVSLVLAVPAAADERLELGTVVEKSLEAMEEQNWEAALSSLQIAIDRFGTADPFKNFGPQFGVIYYRKGLCEMKLQRWEDAMQSFEICYRDFPNPPGLIEGGNGYQILALLKRGEAAMGAGQWELALRQFKKFSDERDRERDSYPKGSFFINLAICNYKLGRIPAGNENLEIAIRNKSVFPTPDVGIVAGFQALVGAVIEQRNEQALLDFVEMNRGEIIIDPYEMHEFSKVFMKLATDAVAANMERSAWVLYQLVPATEAAIDDTRSRLTAMGNAPELRDGPRLIVRENLQRNLAALEAEYRGPEAAEIIQLGATAFLQEKSGNLRGAYAAYRQLERYYPAAAKRENYLSNLIRLGERLGENASAIGEDVAKLLTEFPKSSDAAAAQRSRLTALFHDRDYQQCVALTEPMLAALKSGSADHDLSLYILAGSYHYLGSYDKAQPLLEQHASTYPESPYAQSVDYFRASNLVKLQRWSEAVPLLDEFIKKYPRKEGNVFLPYALYDRAIAQEAEGHDGLALESLARLTGEFPETPVLETAFLLRGKLEEKTGQREAAEKSYLRALEVAEKRKNREVAGEVLFRLVSMLGQKNPGEGNVSRWKDAIPYADRFWEKYGEDSPYQTQMAVAQAHAFYAAGRGEQALKHLYHVITEMVKMPGTPGLEAAIGFYSSVYLEKHTPDQLKTHFEHFSEIPETQRSARAWLRMAVIRAYENVANRSTDEAERRAAEEKLAELFPKLVSDFVPADLTEETLIRLADYYRVKTSTPRQALPFYDEVLSREDSTHRFVALLGRGDVSIRSGSPDDLAKGLADFETVYRESKDPGERDLALFRLVEIHRAKRDFTKTAELAKAYLEQGDRTKTSYAAEVGMIWADALQETGKVDDAIEMYEKIWTGNLEAIGLSAQAVKRWMGLLWERNGAAQGGNLSDRQTAFDGGMRYLNLTAGFKEKADGERLERWKDVEAQVETYRTDPTIQSLPLNEMNSQPVKPVR
jgi:tetratricopeptide (TPR) repeat protein